MASKMQTNIVFMYRATAWAYASYLGRVRATRVGTSKGEGGTQTTSQSCEAGVRKNGEKGYWGHIHIQLAHEILLLRANVASLSNAEAAREAWRAHRTRACSRSFSCGPESKGVHGLGEGHMRDDAVCLEVHGHVPLTAARGQGRPRGGLMRRSSTGRSTFRTFVVVKSQRPEDFRCATGPDLKGNFGAEGVGPGDVRD
ncbi:hypothetical protein FIBSPDRAFT_951257 [Athelia psychrophila]|uniref:Uncharacterized protein n=1 Tax=Athelia psychrophila TaxID=1759441 RepID=A0A166MQ64_9AGAM|nr:hypothetical protein FIBSPDRAFT_951257 [Fibularhizoctonia sp. CBS 109695]